MKLNHNMYWHDVSSDTTTKCSLFWFILSSRLAVMFFSGDAGLIRLNGIGYHFEILSSQLDPTKKS